MNELIHNLVEALREELKEYGELLARLEHQQNTVVRREARELLNSTAAVNAQTETIAAARSEREQRQRCVARCVGLPEDASFSRLMPRIPADYRPLIQALVSENNALLARVQDQAHNNHTLLSRATDLIHHLTTVLTPTHSLK